MTKNQPFLTGFPTQICGSVKRRMQDVIARKRRMLAESSISTYALQFSHILPADFLHKQSRSVRLRHYCNVVVFWAWLAQILEANASLSKAVSLVQAWSEDAGLSKPGDDTGGYSKARGRLGIEFLDAVFSRISGWLAARIRPEDLYRGHVVKSIDGSSLELDDTPYNQVTYPQPSSQKSGCGFPVMGIMGVLNHAHGGWEGVAVGPQKSHDAPVFHKVANCFNAGDVVCADRAFCTYEIIATLGGLGAFALMRLHQARHRALDWKKGSKIDKHQRLYVWTKPVLKPAASPLDDTAWDALPSEMTVRLIRFYYEDRRGLKRRMILVTTLLDAKQYDWQELASLYAGRWDIELRLRDVKVTMQMERLRVRKPETALKTVKMSLIAYNLIKATCQEVVRDYGGRIRTMSFKGALDTIVAFTGCFMRRQKQPTAIRRIWKSMIETISGKTIDERPFRHEPRAKKKRPKNFSYLTKPRGVFKEPAHRGKLRTLA